MVELWSVSYLVGVCVVELWSVSYLVGVCAVLVLGAVGGVGEGLVAALVLTDVGFLSSVGAQVSLQVL